MLQRARNPDQVKVICRDRANVQRVEVAAQRIDNANRTAVLDADSTFLPRAAEALGAENEVNITRVARLSRKDSGKAYGSRWHTSPRAARPRDSWTNTYHKVIETRFVITTIDQRVSQGKTSLSDAIKAHILASNLENSPQDRSLQEQRDRLKAAVSEAVQNVTPKAKASPYGGQWTLHDSAKATRIIGETREEHNIGQARPTKSSRGKQNVAGKGVPRCHPQAEEGTLEGLPRQQRERGLCGVVWGCVVWGCVVFCGAVHNLVHTYGSVSRERISVVVCFHSGRR